MRKKFKKHSVSLNHKRIYYIWHNMISRCTNPNRQAYRNYGAKGVTVCDEWLTDPTPFCEWALANGYGESLSIDRIDPELGYTPANCRWVAMADQSGNRRNRRLYTAWGETKSASDWLSDPRCAVKDRRLVRHRVFVEGWDVERALSTPKQTDPTAYVPRGGRSRSAKLTDEQVAEIRDRLAAKESGASLARQFGVSVSLISSIRLGKRRC